MASSSIHHLGEPINDEMTDQSCRFKVLCSAIKTGYWVYFPAFTTGQHFWRIECMLKREVEGEIGNLLFDLTYGGEWKSVKISVGLGVLKKDEGLSSVKRITTTHTFLHCGRCLRLENVIEGNELKRYLQDDYLIVICNIRSLSIGCLGPVTILSSLSGASESRSIEVRALENKDIASKSLIDSDRVMNTDMTSGLVQFKVICPHITTKEGMWLDFPMFIVGEYSWLMQCWYHKDSHLSFRLYVRSEANDLKVDVKLRVLKKDGVTSSVIWLITTHTFKKCGHEIYMSRIIEDVELKQHLQYDYFTVLCNLTVLSNNIASKHDVTITSSTGKPTSNSNNKPSPKLHDDFARLLQNKDRSDVTFDVKGELFHAHKLILAARSPVFNARLFGPMNENNTENIKVNEIEPTVFNAMLHFIYTDLLPDLDDGGSKNGEINEMDSIEMFQHLLVAADHYALERLKQICEEKLSKFITIDTVGTTLVLAEQHNCLNLKARCLEFATLPQNFMKVAVTDGYRHFELSCPAILKEIEEKLDSNITE